MSFQDPSCCNNMSKSCKNTVLVEIMAWSSSTGSRGMHVRYLPPELLQQQLMEQVSKYKTTERAGLLNYGLG
jgi:hypothetical protein